MRKLLFYICGGLLLLAMPFRKYDTASLLPIICIQAQRIEGKVYLLTEVGKGVGATWAEAVEDLRSNATGELFFDTAEQAVFSDIALAREGANSGILRPGAEAYLAKGFRDPTELHAYLKQHGEGRKIADLQTKEFSYDSHGR